MGLCLHSTFDNAVSLFWSQYDKTEYAKRQVWEKRFPQSPIIDNVMTFIFKGHTVTVTFYKDCDSVKSIQCGLFSVHYTKD